jgi:hypothetical protein
MPLGEGGALSCPCFKLSGLVGSEGIEVELAVLAAGQRWRRAVPRQLLGLASSVANGRLPPSSAGG